MEAAPGRLDRTQQAQFRLLLSALDRAATMRLLMGKSRRFTALRPPDRELALLAMANSPLPLLRTGFQGLKRLALLRTAAHSRPRRVSPHDHYLGPLAPLSAGHQSAIGVSIRAGRSGPRVWGYHRPGRNRSGPPSSRHGAASRTGSRPAGRWCPWRSRHA
jgi:hypothetical protein